MNSGKCECTGKTEELTDSTKFKPYVVFSVGGGVTRFMGDVQDASEKANVHLIDSKCYDPGRGVALKVFCAECQLIMVTGEMKIRLGTSF